MLWGSPYLVGLPFKGVYMGYPYPYFCLYAFLGPYPTSRGALSHDVSLDI